MSRIGTMAPPPRAIQEVEKGGFGILNKGLHVVDEKGANNALTSQTTVAMQDDGKRDMWKCIGIDILLDLADNRSSSTCNLPIVRVTVNGFYRWICEHMSEIHKSRIYLYLTLFMWDAQLR
jgi:hypothetical protein